MKGSAVAPGISPAAFSACNATGDGAILPEPALPGRFGRPEDEVLLCCARRELPEALAERVQRLVRGGLTWDYLLHAAYRHKLVPLLYRHFRALCPEAVPARVMQQLQVSSHRVTGFNLFITGELVRLLNLLAAHRIDALAFKGPTLGVLAYGNPGLRPFGDLDLLIQKQDLAKCKTLLLEEGYAPRKTTARDADLGQGDAYGLERDGVVVELHWVLVPQIYSFAPDLQAYWDRSIHVALGGCAVRTLAPEDLILYLCVHGAKHRWDRLRWLCDLAEVMRAFPRVQWDLVLERARALRSERMLHLGLRLAHDLLEAPLPAWVAQRLSNDAAARCLAEKVKRRMFEEESLSRSSNRFAYHMKRFAFHLRMRERLRDRLAYYLYVPRRCLQLARIALMRSGSVE